MRLRLSKIFTLFIMLINIPLISSAYTVYQEDYFIAVKGTNQQGHIKKLIDMGETELAERPSKAMKYAQESLFYAERAKDTRAIFDALALIGKVHWVHGDYVQDLQNSIRMLSIAETLDNDTLRMISLEQIATANSEMKYHSKAFQYRYQSLDLARKLNQEKWVALLYTNLGNEYLLIRDFERAIDYTHKAILTYDKLKDPEKAGFCLMNMGEIYIEMGALEKALNYTHQAYEVMNSHQNVLNRTYVLKNLGVIYREIGNYVRAENYLSEGLKLALSINAKAQISSIYEHLFINAEKGGNVGAALSFHKNFKAYNDSIYSLEKSKQMATLQAIYDAEKREKEIDLLNKESEIKQAKLNNEQLWNAMLIAGVVALFVFCGYIFYNYKKKAKGNKLLHIKNRILVKQREEISIQKEKISSQNEAMTEANEKLSILNQEKSHLIGVVAHDLKSPLNQIVGFMSLMRLEFNSCSGIASEYFTQIESCSKHMSEMITKILDVEAIDAQQVNLKMEAADIRDIIGALHHDYLPKARKKEIDLKYNVSRESAWVNIDLHYAHQVLENLLSNSIKFTKVGSTVQIGLTAVDGKVKIDFTDQGPGIAPEEMHLLFGKYQKLSARPTGGEHSTGLGLSIVKKYVEIMGGEVSCESENGHGATFSVVFPQLSEMPVN